MRLELAQSIARGLASLMLPYCDQFEIAGSIRRNAQDVKDIEIVCVPILLSKMVRVGIFGEEEQHVEILLHNWAMSSDCPIRWIKPGTSEIVDWKPKADGKYWRGLVDDIKVDVFIPKPTDWGITLLVRTGCAEFSHAVATHAPKVGCKLEGGGLLVHGCPVATLEERDAFARLMLPYVEPHHRDAGMARTILNR